MAALAYRFIVNTAANRALLRQCPKASGPHPPSLLSTLFLGFNHPNSCKVQPPYKSCNLTPQKSTQKTPHSRVFLFSSSRAMLTVTTDAPGSFVFKLNRDPFWYPSAFSPQSCQTVRSAPAISGSFLSSTLPTGFCPHPVPSSALHMTRCIGPPLR